MSSLDFPFFLALAVLMMTNWFTVQDVPEPLPTELDERLDEYDRVGGF